MPAGGGLPDVSYCRQRFTELLSPTIVAQSLAQVPDMRSVSLTKSFIARSTTKRTSDAQIIYASTQEIYV